MKQRILIAGIFSVIALLLQSTHDIVSAQSPRYDYALYSFESTTSSKLTFLNSMGEVQAPSIENLPISADTRLMPHFQTSSDGQWIQYLLAEASRPFSPTRVRVFNVQSKQNFELNLGAVLFPPNYPSLQKQAIVFSPNNQYLAVNIYDTTRKIALLSLTTGQTTILPNQLGEQTWIAWSPDSKSLATVDQGCTDPTNVLTCSYAVQIISVQSNAITQTLQLPNLKFGPAIFGLAICDLKWSPDSRYINFVSVCDSTLFSETKEVYIWDIVTKEAIAATKYTAKDQIGRTKAYLTGLYQTHWLDSNNLQISSVYANLTENLYTAEAQTIVFSVTNKTSQVIANEALWDIAINPTTQEIAFRAQPNGVNLGQLANERPVSSGRVSTNGILSITKASRESAGCNLAWSPDGKFLAYTRQADCRTNAQSVVFVSNTDQSVKEYAIPTVNQGAVGSIVPIGWVRIQP